MKFKTCIKTEMCKRKLNILFSSGATFCFVQNARVGNSNRLPMTDAKRLAS